jgi:RNA polymerase sigma-54 factor
MALELKQSLSLNQQLIMTPQLQQAIKLLQLSRLELLDTIYQEMETNPILEENPAAEGEEEVGGDRGPEAPGKEDGAPQEVKLDGQPKEDLDWESYLSDYNTGWAEAPHEDREFPSFESVASSKTNLYSHLLWQLNMAELSDVQKEIGANIIGNLDEDGYLDISLEEIAQATGQSVDQVIEVLQIVQNFDPVGVASRDTGECLLIQARFHGLSGTLVEKIIQSRLRDLEDKRYDQIAKAFGVPLEEVVSAVAVIRGFEPKPGRLYTDDQTIYISPDVYVFRAGDGYEIVLNEDGLPKLRVNSYYKEMLSSRDNLSEGARNYIQEKLKSAAWLIKSIHQRQRTIYRVTESLVKFQSGFLEKGVTHLKPLVLRDVAEDIQMHESTISRVTTNKYVYTPQGVFELKYFFNSSVSSVDGDAVASESVKEHIRNIVKSENPLKPYSDQEISEVLKRLNVDVARRTVAKYRESMGILPSRRRRRPYGIG